MNPHPSAHPPVVVIGAGPVGLAAAAHLLERGLRPLVLEAGDSVGTGMLGWGHVRMFSPWEYTIDRAAGALLERHGWTPPDAQGFPTGAEVVEQYLRPLAAVPELAAHLRLGARVEAVTKWRHDRMKDGARGHAPFLVRYRDADGEHEVRAQGVIDASGTIDTPNPLGASGIPAAGEPAARERLFYGMPDVLGRDRGRYAGKRVLVVGSGHSAFNVLQDLALLSAQAPATTIQWALRRPSLQRVLGGGAADQLPERGRLGTRIANLVEAGVLQVATGFHVERIEPRANGLVLIDGDRELGPFDEIVGATGFRPDHGLLSELRLALDPGTQAPVALAPLIDPNLHSCGSVRPHGADELAHPDAGVYIVGMKSYGRAPTFLLLTGYEQVRSVAAALAGDWEAARRVELRLPETGVCRTQFAEEEDAAIGNPFCARPDTATAPVRAAPTHAAAGLPMPVRAVTGAAAVAGRLRHGPTPAVRTTAACCGGPATADPDACCVRDADAKARGEAGCGCAERAARREATVACCG